MENVDFTCNDNDAKRLKLEDSSVPRGAAGNGGNDSDTAGSDEDRIKLFVRNVDRKASEQEIVDFFGKFGKVEEVRKGHKCQTTAFVTFASGQKVDVFSVDKDDLLFKNRILVIKDSNGKKNSTSQLSNIVDSHYDAELPTHIHSLPDETLDHVFSFLTVPERIRTESVCKRWRTLGKKLPWRGPIKLDLGTKFVQMFYNNKTKWTNRTVASILSRCGGCVKDLTLHKYGGVTDKVLELVGKFCPNLVILDVNGFPKKSGDDKSPLLSVPKHCPKLREVTLTSFTLDDKLLRAFLEMCPSLQSIGLKLTFYLTGEGLDKVSKNLTSFLLERCRSSSAILTALKKGNNKIQDLSLLYCSVSFPMLLEVCTHYKKTLRALHLDGQACSFSEWTQILSPLTQNLEELSLSHCPDIVDKTLEVLVAKCVKLRCLNVSATKITDVGVAALSSAQCLKVLDISYTRVVGGGIDNLAAQGKLEELYVRKLPKWANDIEFGCLALVKYCRNLRVLDVSANPKITPKLVEAFQSSVKQGFFHRQTVQLIVGDTLVQKPDIEHCDRLQVVFESSASALPNLSDDDCSDGFYSDDYDDSSDSDNYRDSDDVSDFFGFLSYLV